LSEVCSGLQRLKIVYMTQVMAENITRKCDKSRNERRKERENIESD
jgi:hypothetical protein